MDIISYFKNFSETFFKKDSVRRETQDSIEWNRKNISIIVSLLFVISGVLIYVYFDSTKDFEKRMAKYNAMSTEEMASFLARVNNDPETLDVITEHVGTKKEDNRVYFFRELKSNPLTETLLTFNSIEEQQKRMFKNLKNSMCGIPVYDLFYNKGGEVIYVYNKVSDLNKTFLFDVTINKSICENTQVKK